MHKISELVVKCRKIIIFINVLLSLVLGYFIKDIKIDPDIVSYLPKTDPVVKLFNYIGEEYGGNYLAMVALETDDIFNKETIERINYLSKQFKLVDGVSYVTSLTNVIDIKKDEYNGIEIKKLIDEYNLPQTDNEIQRIKKYTLLKDLYRGKLVSEDSKATLIVCRLSEDAERIKTAQKLKEIVKKANLKEKVYYGGLPFQMRDISDIILSDLKLLTPLVSLLIVVSLFLSFRTLTGMILPLVSVAFSTIWVLGIMSILKIPITVLSDAIPVILIAVGSAYGIHVVSKFAEEEMTEENKNFQSKMVLSEVSVPVMLAAITTMAGFLSFIFGSYLSAIREFGILTSLGVFFAWIISVTFIPAVLSLLSVRGKAMSFNNGVERKNIVTNFLDKLSEFVLKNEKVIVGGGIIIIVICIFGITKIERRVDMLDYFKTGTPIRVTEEMMEKKFGGSIPIQILVKGDIQDPMILKEMKKMGKYLESQGAYNSQSVADLIEEMSDVMGEGKTIPDSKEKVSNLWFLLEGEEVMSQLVNPEKTEAVIQATITNIDTARIRILVENIEDYIKKTNTSLFTFDQTGMPIIYQHLDDSILRSQIASLIIAIILVYLCMVFLLHSFIGALIGLVPIIFTLFVIYGLMGFSTIPLDVATALTGSITIGIGIDYSIHFISRFRNEFKKDKTELEALEKTLETTGKAILINVIAVTLGFLVLVFGNLVPLKRGGILMGMSMVSSGFAAIILLPAMIILTKAGFIGDFSRFINGAKNHLTNKLKVGGDNK
jgi:hypothetical protein